MASRRSSNYSREAWEGHRSLIHRLYLMENWTCKKIRQHLKDKKGFNVTERQIKNRLGEWGLECKKTSARHYQAMLAFLEYYAAIGSEVDFVVPKRGDRVVYSAKKVKKECERIKKRELKTGCFSPCTIDNACAILEEACINLIPRSTGVKTPPDDQIPPRPDQISPPCPPHIPPTTSTTVDEIAPKSDTSDSTDTLSTVKTPATTDTPPDDCHKSPHDTNGTQLDSPRTSEQSVENEVSKEKHATIEIATEDTFLLPHRLSTSRALCRSPTRSDAHSDTALDAQSLRWLQNAWEFKKTCYSSSLSTCNELPFLALSKKINSCFTFRGTTSGESNSGPTGQASIWRDQISCSDPPAAGPGRSEMDLMFSSKLRCSCGVGKLSDSASSTTGGDPRGHSQRRSNREPRSDSSVEIEFIPVEATEGKNEASDGKSEIETNSSPVRSWAGSYLKQCFAIPADKPFLELAKKESIDRLNVMLQQEDGAPVLPDLSWSIMMLGSNSRTEDLKDLLHTCVVAIDKNSEKHANFSLALPFRYALASVSNEICLMDILSRDLPEFFLKCGLRWTENHPNFLVASHFYAWDLMRLGNYSRAIPLLIACLPLSTRMMGTHHTLTVNCLVMLSRAYKETEEHFWSLFCLRQAMAALDELRQRQRDLPFLDCFCLSLLYRQGQVLSGVGDNVRLAEEQFWRVWCGRMVVCGVGSCTTWSASQTLCRILEETGRPRHSRRLDNYMTARLYRENCYYVGARQFEIKLCRPLDCARFVSLHTVCK